MLAILAIFIPLVTIWVIWFALALAAFAAFSGDKSFPIAVILICFVNLLFFSPLTLMVLKGESLQGGFAYKIITFIAFIAPIVGLFLASASGNKPTEIPSERPEIDV